MDDMDGETSPRNPIQLSMIFPMYDSLSAVSQSPVKPHSLGENNNQGFKLSYINLFQDVRAAMVTPVLCHSDCCRIMYIWMEHSKRLPWRIWASIFERVPRLLCYLTDFERAALRCSCWPTQNTSTPIKSCHTSSITRILNTNHGLTTLVILTYYNMVGNPFRCYYCQCRKANLLWSRNYPQRGWPRDRSP